MKINKTKDQKHKILCRNCKITTNHNTLLSINTTFDGEHGEQYWEDEDYELIQCLGCETISFRYQYMSEDSFYYDEKTGTEKVFPKIEIYPKIKIETLQYDRQDLIKYVPYKIEEIYNEILDSYNNNLKILTSAGIKIILEAIRKDYGANKIEDLLNKGVLSSQEQVDCILNFINFGNNAIHELETTEMLKTSIEIIQHIINYVYIIPKKIK